MRASILINALVAVLVGFGGSVAIVISAADAIGATQTQTASMIAALCAAMMATTGYLSWRHKMPIVTAWSTPGAALIATTSSLSIEIAVGSFLFAGILLVLTATLRPLGDVIARIPPRIAAAILAGVLFQFALGLVNNAAAIPALGLPLVILFFLIRLFSPSWAVLAVLAVGFTLTFLLDLAAPVTLSQGANLALITPEFSLTALIGVALPLYLVTMASQNLPGFAVLTASGYTPPSRSIIASTGLASVLTAPFGAVPTSLAAITASICTGPDTHPDPSKRWLAGPFYAAGYGSLALAGASVVALLAAMPPELIGLIAGAALLGPFVGSAKLAFSGEGDDAAPGMAFVVTASGLSLFGIGAAFWGLAIGVALTVAAELRHKV